MKIQIKNILNKGTKYNASESERQEMLALFHKPENEFEIKEELFEKISTVNISIVEHPDYRNLFSKLWAQIENSKKPEKSKILYLSLKIAAAIIVGLFIGVYISSIQTVSEKPIYYAAHSPRGSVSEMLLPDNTVIFLNADSRVKYTINGKNNVREVFLSGEAWFDVAKNEEKPFIVHTSCYNIEVTGTQFNVKAYETDNEIITTLEEGQVKIVSSENFQLAEEITLEPGEQLKLNKDLKKVLVNKTENTAWYTSWKDNKLIFINTDFKNLVILLERKYGVDIEVKNKEILNLHFDGTIKNESILEILKIIKKTLPINYNIEGQKVVITNNN